jgi:hypothetical protein
MSDAQQSQPQTDGGNSEATQEQGQESATASSTNEAGAQDTPSTPAWMAQLPGNLQGNEQLAGFSSIGELANAYLHTGTDAQPTEAGGTEKPDDPADTVPDDPSAYELTRPDSWPENVPWSEQQWTALAEKAHELGMTKRQAQEVFNLLTEQVQSSYTQAQENFKAQKQEGLQKLQQELGDEYQGKLELARRAYESLGGEELKEFLAASGLDDHPTFVRTFVEIANRISDDAFIPGSSAGAQGSIEKSWYPNTDFSR